MYNFINYLRCIGTKNKLAFFICIFLSHKIIVPMETREVDFPREFIQLSQMVEKMAQDVGETETVKVRLPASDETIKDVFTIFSQYNPEGPQDEIRNEIRSYSLDKLVYVANLLQHLDVPDAIMDIVMDQIAAVLNDRLTLLISSLNDYIHQGTENVVLPYYEPLKNLNPDVEKIIKTSFKINNTLQWHIQDIWAVVGKHNSKQELEREIMQFRQSRETIMSFLDRNVSAIVLKFIEDKQRENLLHKLPKDDTSTQNISKNFGIGAVVTAAAIAALWKLYNYMTESKQ